MDDKSGVSTSEYRGLKVAGNADMRSCRVTMTKPMKTEGKMYGTVGRFFFMVDRLGGS